jgi:hypothetical protein
MKKNTKSKPGASKTAATTAAPVKKTEDKTSSASIINQIEIPKFLEAYNTIIESKLNFLTNEYNKFLMQRSQWQNTKAASNLLLWIKYYIELCEHEILQGVSSQNKYLLHKLYEVPDEKILFNNFNLFKDTVWTPRFDGNKKKRLSVENKK